MSKYLTEDKSWQVIDEQNSFIVVVFVLITLIKQRIGFGKAKNMDWRYGSVSTGLPTSGPAPCYDTAPD